MGGDRRAVSSDSLERRFDAAMGGIYEDAKAAGYNASYFLRMLSEHGGVEAARCLVVVLVSNGTY